MMKFWPFKRKNAKPDPDEVIRIMLHYYEVTDPCEAAWTEMALRKLMPEYGFD